MSINLRKMCRMIHAFNLNLAPNRSNTFPEQKVYSIHDYFNQILLLIVKLSLTVVSAVEAVIEKFSLLLILSSAITENT